MSATTTYRPRKLNAATAKVVVSAVRAGAHRQTAAQLAGVDQSTLSRWLARGREDQAAGRRTSCRKLVEEVEQGEASFTLRALGQIQQSAAAGDARSAMWLLERRHWAEWGRADRLSLGGEITHEHRHELHIQGLEAGQSPIELNAALRRQAAELLQEAADKADAVVDVEVVEEEETGAHAPAAVLTVGGAESQGSTLPTEDDAQAVQAVASMHAHEAGD
jgi:hypothetical protein